MIKLNIIYYVPMYSEDFYHHPQNDLLLTLQCDVPYKTQKIRHRDVMQHKMLNIIVISINKNINYFIKCI